MKRLVSLLLGAAVLSGCQSNQNDEIQALKQEINELKSVQREVAVRVGLAELVRPDVLPLSKDGQWLGNKEADIVILEYTDLHCPFCKKFQQDVFPELKAAFIDSGEVAFLARELPLSKVHPKAPYAAVLLRCAAQQDQYEPVREKLFELGANIVPDDIDTIISEFELDKEDYDSCRADKSVHQKVSDSILEAKTLGLESTPSFIVGRRDGNTLTDYKIIVGAGSVEQFSAAIKALR